MDFKKAFAASKKSIIAIIGIWIAAVVLGMIPVIGFIGGLLALLQGFVLNPILLAFAGFVMAKEMKGTLTDGALAGAVAAAGRRRWSQVAWHPERGSQRSTSTTAPPAMAYFFPAGGGGT